MAATRALPPVAELAKEAPDVSYSPGPLPTAAAVRDHLNDLQQDPSWAPPAAFAIGIATLSTVGEHEGQPHAFGEAKVLDTYFPAVNLGDNVGFVALVAAIAGVGPGSGTTLLDQAMLDQALSLLTPILAEGGEHPNAVAAVALTHLRNAPAPVGPTRRVPVLTVIADLDEPPVDTHDAYLRLHLISTRRIRPHGCNLDGLFGKLNNVVWTNLGPFDPDGFEATRAMLRAMGTVVEVTSVDKFPQMADYVIPSGVRMATPSRVRLGAYLGDGTTVMHEGFVNYNAGTEGPAMVEGRISAGVFVGADSDIGGGASIMGTLSGGGKEVVSIGSKCLLGANAGLGISLGDNCVVEAGLYLTAGTIVLLPDGSYCKARELSSMNDLLFRRNSKTGAVEMLPQSAEWGGLNAALHSND